MKILALGDVVGRSGREAVLQWLPEIRRNNKLDHVILNGENAAGGFGLTADIANQFFKAGADVVSLGNHSWDQREMLSHIETDRRIIRPANYPAGTPGRGYYISETVDGKRVLSIQVMGRLFMDPLDDPFAAVEHLLSVYKLKNQVDAIVVDVHGEASSERQAMGFFLDGRVSAVFGTHTHVPTADHHILPAGTAYQTDLGMIGDYNSVIGFDHVTPVKRFATKLPTDRLAPATGEATVSGLYIETNDKTGLAQRCEAVRLGGSLSQQLPSEWTLDIINSQTS
jgi:metallophosphoesterase (TIGR00282 family)